MAVSASKANGAWNCAQKYVEDDGVRKENGNLSVVHTRLLFFYFYFPVCRTLCFYTLQLFYTDIAVGTRGIPPSRRLRFHLLRTH